MGPPELLGAALRFHHPVVDLAVMKAVGQERRNAAACAEEMLIRFMSWSVTVGYQGLGAQTSTLPHSWVSRAQKCTELVNTNGKVLLCMFTT